MTDPSNKMVFKRQLLHSVSGSGKIILSKKMLDEAGLAPGMFIEVVIKRGSITIFPISKSKRIRAAIAGIKIREPPAPPLARTSTGSSRSKWTLNLLADKLVEMEVVDSIS